MIALRNDQLCASCHFANETHRIVTADKVMTGAIWGNNQQKGSHLVSSSMVLPWKLELLCPLEVWLVEAFARLEFAWLLKGRA